MNQEEIDKHQIAEDIHCVLRERELSLPKYKGKSSHLYYRRYVVDRLAIISEKLRLSHGILHLAVAYLDLIMEKMEFNRSSHLNLLGLCCLWIAAKLDENDHIIPRMTTMQQFDDSNDYFADDFLRMESIILAGLDWRLLVPTTVQYLDYYIEKGVGDGDLHAGYSIVAKEKAKVYIKKYARYFLEVALQDHSFNTFLPSLVTSAAIASSRQCMNITPTWPIHLVKVTGYEYDNLHDCVEKLMTIHKDDDERRSCGKE